MQEEGGQSPFGSGGRRWPATGAPEGKVSRLQQGLCVLSRQNSVLLQALRSGQRLRFSRLPAVFGFKDSHEPCFINRKYFLSDEAICR